MLDSPPPDKADLATYDAVIDVFIAAAGETQTRAALISSLPETISARVRRRCLDGRVVPLQGQREALEARSSGLKRLFQPRPAINILMTFSARIRQLSIITI